MSLQLKSLEFVVFLLDVEEKAHSRPTNYFVLSVTPRSAKSTLELKDKDVTKFSTSERDIGDLSVLDITTSDR